MSTSWPAYMILKSLQHFLQLTIILSWWLGHQYSSSCRVSYVGETVFMFSYAGLSSQLLTLGTFVTIMNHLPASYIQQEDVVCVR